ncbi:MAG: putative holin-like toxin [Defluviitaleaceae bacterium]|nr:putative holin-like toxin [Defluviitaleaceae bacterium]
MTAFDTIMMVLTIATLIVSIISLVVDIVKNMKK